MTRIRSTTVRTALLSGISLAATIAFAGPAVAQSAEEADAGVEEIIVTAQRKEEALSKVPVSVVAFGAEVLQEKVIVSEQDMGTLVPGLQVKNGQTSNQLSYSMRGQTLDPFSGTSPAVVTYLNDAPYNPYNTATSLFDLASIQVLKGPQGTLFGRNATGGAVLYTTPTPGDEVAGNLILRAGQRGMVQVQGAVDLPIVKDILSIRLAGDYVKDDGYVRNANTGNLLGGKDNVSGRLTVLFKPSETIKNTTVVQYADFGGTEGTGNLWNYYTSPFARPDGKQFINNGITSVPNTTGLALTSTLDTVYNVFSSAYRNRAGNNLGDSTKTPGPANAPGRFPGGVEGYAAWSRANPYKTWLEFDLPHKATATFFSNKTEIEISEAATIRNIFSYMDGKSRMSGNLANAPFGALWLYNNPNNLSGLSGTGGPGGQTFNSEQFSNELQLQGELADNRLGYTIGAYYSSLKHLDIIPVCVGCEIAPSPLADIDYATNSKGKSKAIYAQLDYDLSEELTLTLGGRYTWEKVSLSQAQGSIFTILGITSVGREQSRDLSAPAWTANLQYQISPSSMIYFSQRGSFRVGNFNGTVNPGGDSNFFKNETVHDFELGYKFNGSLGTMRTQFNLAAYNVIVKDGQHAVYAVIDGNPAGFTLNVPKAKTTGVEVDASIGLTDWLTFSMNGAYTDARYTSGAVNVSKLTGVPGYVINFDSYPDSPKWAGNFALDITLPLSESVGKVVLHGDVYTQTSTFFSNNNGSVTPGTQLPGYTISNARLSWNNAMGSNFSASVYVKNLLDKLNFVSGYAMGAAGGYNTVYPGMPRTFGAEISVKF
ncbi:TonB-dependent receptor [Sphingorhabdus sp.]|uniref:TonB-dependent receptor n=1 Tax=Sphingorhabdus sp. TaxID=1902408 RepID=UPI0037C7A89F